ncbi:ATP-dependent DNA helicase SRS2-like protein [Sesamum angolense]|uniref:ATP-dependent DNA helicase SRS2-like protein n=1 Tax=Sesamum angolense TaxID=2727404 RepID=A0AAE1VZC7_9LAMI|nr:ATP-dependent DNA helicase SRS2-like protein [Sesamum angolense]
MNNKENAVVIPAGGELSAEQRARISKSFRAAKALLAANGQGSTLAPSCHLSSNQNSMLSNWSGDDVNNGVKSEILLTPVRQAECRSRQCVGDASSSANELKDEGFGVGKLEEIDALCEQKSSGNSERDDTTMNRTENEIIVKSCEEDVVITNPQVSYETLKSKEILNSNVDQAFGVERVGKSENKLTKNMPEEYAKYIQSLNDKQQEAACNDISIPLVIVAGPGSGKTSTMVGRVLMLLYEVVLYD